MHGIGAQCLGHHTHSKSWLGDHSKLVVLVAVVALYTMLQEVFFWLCRRHHRFVILDTHGWLSGPYWGSTTCVCRLVEKCAMSRQDVALTSEEPVRQFTPRLRVNQTKKTGSGSGS